MSRRKIDYVTLCGSDDGPVVINDMSDLTVDDRSLEAGRLVEIGVRQGRSRVNGYERRLAPLQARLAEQKDGSGDYTVVHIAGRDQPGPVVLPPPPVYWPERVPSTTGSSRLIAIPELVELLKRHQLPRP